MRLVWLQRAVGDLETISNAGERCDLVSQRNSRT